MSRNESLVIAERLETRVLFTAALTSATPGTPDLDISYDNGWSPEDNLTNRNNSAVEKELKFLVPGTIPGATVSLFIDGTLAASATAADGTTSTTLLTTPGAAATLADGTHGVTTTLTEPGKDPSAPSAALSITIDTRRPQIAAPGTFAVEPVQTAAFTADEPLRESAVDSVPSIYSKSGQINWGDVHVGYDDAAKQVKLTFPGYPHGLPDGDYRVVIGSINFDDAAGNPLTSSFLIDFFVLAGDANRDRSVGPADFNILASHFGQTGQTFTAGDFDYDGSVGAGDFNLLASRFGTSLGPPPPQPLATTGTLRQRDTDAATVTLAPIARKRLTVRRPPPL
jgi:hypothetical protein